ncbi:hypothetical protein [Marinobacterium jannaschii]|uniref:hypothetical protein n=1 Tax=Marinobacterium jannaschii TaxID=64970 RepID=UPI000480A7F7|nr:hypothetical protein [Marinobacterium jannaschii]
MTSDNSPISTSVLAKKLGKSSKQMFAELEALRWIKREDDHWILTPKGEFEGGRYKTSDKFGTYVVWPVTVLQHQALVTPDSHLKSATALGRELDLSAGRINQLLKTLGWIEAQQKGWVTTRAGKLVGAAQRQNERSGVPYLLWPEDLPTYPAFADICQRWLQPRPGAALDGHQHDSAARVQIDNWLYLAGLLHSCQHPLPLDEPLKVDFWLPQSHICIQYWGDLSGAGQLSEMMAVRERIDELGFGLIELQPEDLDQLDQLLPKLLLKLGVEI